MGALSLFERYLANCREFSDWSKQPDTLFEDQARTQLLAEGHRIDDCDPLHKMAIAYRVGFLRERTAELSGYVEMTYADQMRAKGGRPTRSFEEIMLQVAAFYRCKALGKADTKAELCSAAAKALGRPTTAATVRKAMGRLPHIALALQSQLPEEASPDEGAKLTAGLISSIGKDLCRMGRALSDEQGLVAGNRKSARFAPVLVFDGGAP